MKTQDARAEENSERSVTPVTQAASATLGTSKPSRNPSRDPGAGFLRGGFSRRNFLTGVGLVSATAAVGATTACASDDNDAADAAGSPLKQAVVVPFDGPHQAGIATPIQTHHITVAFTLRDGVDAKGIKRLLSIWTGDARRLCAGDAVLADLEPELGTNPGRLTVTCGFGRSLMVKAGAVHRAPSWLKPLPAFSGDRLEQRWGERDIVLQICGENQTTVSHALRVLVRGGADYARPSWTQVGFLNPPIADDGTSGTPRNLFGFKDGTVNPHTNNEFDDQVWIGEGAAAHSSHIGGTCMIVRRIVYDMPLWESVDRPTREVAFGRTTVEGAPLSGTREEDSVDVTAVGPDGLPLIDPNSHVALATVHGGDERQRLLRRAYNFDLPVNPATVDGLEEADLIRLADTGLIFTCFQADPMTSFVPIQRRLAEGDRLNEWITHVGSAVFFIPPGTEDGQYWGESLLS